MAFVTTRDGINLHVKDMGTGRPVLLVHGWPLSGDMWEYQTLALVEAGYRVITYDRRGFGQSSHPVTGYDYDTLADDLAAIIDALALDAVTLVGFSMGGGEIARYLSRHGASKIAGAVLLASVVPGILKSPDNPEGFDLETLAGLKKQIRKDRFHFLRSFARDFYGMSLLGGPVSEALLDWHFALAIMASPMATLDCVDAWGMTDFTADTAAFTVPTLIIHGTWDSSVPAKIAGERAAKLIPHARYIPYEDAPHGLFATHHAMVNADLLAFLAETA
ncbi:alpha/beta fold hydrolase [Acidomonas methanolica]|uniref:alpha/beta fold hydrolase n=1 Tax=Acidomonas methanolica TaxID=437 RepID=UPI00211A3D92|nr:alpha/beta hydrolase [Acidomonas methanolica]MCQ9155479.1 alpha/beta hydrolase [Acidomonas methanolica]